MSPKQRGQMAQLGRSRRIGMKFQVRTLKDASLAGDSLLLVDIGVQSQCRRTKFFGASIALFRSR